MSEPLPTEEEFAAWKSDFVTRWVVRLLHKKREDLRQDWEGGRFTDYEQGAMVLVNVGNIGTCKGYAFVTDLDYESFITELDIEERVRPETAGSGNLD